LGQALGRQHVLHLRGADPEREGAEGAMGGGVGVAAHDRHARLRQSELGADHVDDALVRAAELVEADVLPRTVPLQRLQLPARKVVDLLGPGRGVVIGGRDRQVGPVNRPAGQPEAGEGLR